VAAVGPKTPRVQIGVNEAVAQLEGDTLAVMLYGSHARGDATPTSDIDLLQIVPQFSRSYVLGPTTVVAYTPDQLRSMAKGGSLFAWHLRTEGRVLDDPSGVLRGCLEIHAGPACEKVLARLEQLSALLDLDPSEFQHYANRAIRTARYLLRTAVYARSLRSGEQSFAVERAAKAAGADGILPLLRRGTDTNEDWSTFLQYRTALASLIGPLDSNPYGSLEALAVNLWDEDHQMASLAIQTMASRDGEIEYATLPPPAL
jgi:Nucleotidyltransferase domain